MADKINKSRAISILFTSDGSMSTSFRRGSSWPSQKISSLASPRVPDVRGTALSIIFNKNWVKWSRSEEIDTVRNLRKRTAWISQLTHRTGYKAALICVLSADVSAWARYLLKWKQTIAVSSNLNSVKITLGFTNDRTLMMMFRYENMTRSCNEILTTYWWRFNCVRKLLFVRVECGKHIIRNAKLSYILKEN